MKKRTKLKELVNYINQRKGCVFEDVLMVPTDSESEEDEVGACKSRFTKPVR